MPSRDREPVEPPAGLPSGGRGAEPQRGYAGFIDRLNARLLPWLGPPPLGPYDEPAVPPQQPGCPLCGRPMPEHVIDRTAPRTQLRCP